MANINKIKIDSTSYDIESILSWSNVADGFRLLTIPIKANDYSGNELYMLNGTKSHVVTNNLSYGTQYWSDITFYIPNELRKNIVISCNVNVCLLESGTLMSAEVVGYTNESVTVRYWTPISGAWNVATSFNLVEV